MQSSPLAQWSCAGSCIVVSGSDITTDSQVNDAEFALLVDWSYLFVQVEACRAGLQASLFVRHPETQQIYLNFDPQILTLMRESECMARMGLEVPPNAQLLRARQHTLKENYDKLQVWLFSWAKKIFITWSFLLLPSLLLSSCGQVLCCFSANSRNHSVRISGISTVCCLGSSERKTHETSENPWLFAPTWFNVFL